MKVDHPWRQANSYVKRRWDQNTFSHLHKNRLVRSTQLCLIFPGLSCLSCRFHNGRLLERTGRDNTRRNSSFELIFIESNRLITLRLLLEHQWKKQLSHEKTSYLSACSVNPCYAECLTIVFPFLTKAFKTTQAAALYHWHCQPCRHACHLQRPILARGDAGPQTGPHLHYHVLA